MVYGMPEFSTNSQLLSYNHDRIHTGKDMSSHIYALNTTQTIDSVNTLSLETLVCLSGLGDLTISVTVSGASDGVLQVSATAGTDSSSTLSLDGPVD